jgi:acetyl esterase/lipase
MDYLRPVRRLLMLAAFVASGLAAWSTPADGREPERPTVLLIHGGGFVVWNGMVVSTRPFRRLGYRVAIASYPSGDVRAAYRAVTEQARRLRRRSPLVIAVGESAGGSIATWLAGHRDVDAAITIGAPENFETWGVPGWAAQVGLPTAELRRRYSPFRSYRRSSGDAPLLAFQYRHDPFVPREQVVPLRARGARVRLLEGLGHTQPRWLRMGGLAYLRRLRP